MNGTCPLVSLFLPLFLLPFWIFRRLLPIHFLISLIQTSYRNINDLWDVYFILLLLLNWISLITQCGWVNLTPSPLMPIFLRLNMFFVIFQAHDTLLFVLVLLRPMPPLLCVVFCRIADALMPIGRPTQLTGGAYLVTLFILRDHWSPCQLLNKNQLLFRLRRLNIMRCPKHLRKLSGFESFWVS